tara:strand:- start:38208 stop:38453 length:246 start_codon:yes stop_codon:yes gene_type:complete
MGRNKKKLNEHRKFRNQCIVMTIVLLGMGVFMFIPFEFLSNDSPEVGGILITFGVIMGAISIFNIFTYMENKIDYDELNNK